MSATRRDIQIESHGNLLGGWLYTPSTLKQKDGKYPAIVLAHGLGAVKEMALDRYSERFSAAGFLCVVFDYRFFGSSTGRPRGLIDPSLQLEDWSAALDYTKSLPDVDTRRIGIFGSSFSGGHVIRVAAAHPDTVSAVVSQCPFTDGLASARQVPLRTLPSTALLALRDQFFSTNDEPVRIKLVGEPGEVALMSTEESMKYKGLVPPGMKLEIEAVPARIVLKMPLLYPGSYTSQVQCPIMFGICGKDSVAPPKPTEYYAKKAPKGTIKYYPEMGHFDIYLGENFEKAVGDYVAFLDAVL
ncbi:hypothetical protein MVES1_001474 [Malassezia vespertilionis]|uniref:Xaa-Pro dipeptidyl-peptidase-like domain-containing protein n=1 Tax=Malassezia vespertilionis TaxID=2020962 RepID=A0A2N1JDS1_9BASI|nr:uncharacterized protein MVES1_001474 [Malassezia vespertilionis]PKI84672.1 hypothetical protein MVES_001389 [Malassezia vespertilionis]WFD06132.1 hypothetical protein MVES1_001474 [Malassezia vespertilionis]